MGEATALTQISVAEQVKDEQEDEQVGVQGEEPDREEVDQGLQSPAQAGSCCEATQE